MKAARVVVLSVVGFAILLLIVVGVGLSSWFQTWAARRALGNRPELHATLGSISGGLKRIEVRALKIEFDGAVLTLPALDAELPLVSAGLSKRVALKSVVAKGWTLDLTKAKQLPEGAGAEVQSSSDAASVPTGNTEVGSSGVSPNNALAATTETVFRGVFTDLHLPVDLSLDGVDLEGEIILPATAGHNSSPLRATLNGGGLASGQDGKFSLNLTGASLDGDELKLNSTLVIGMDTPRTFNHLSVKADATAQGPKFPTGAALKIEATALRSDKGENYGLLLLGNGKQLADMKAELVSTTARIGGTWTIDVHDSDLAPFTLGLKLPTFDAAGHGSFETGIAFKEIHASGRLDAAAKRFENMRPELSAVGAIRVIADFDVLQHGDSLRVERFDSSISGAAPVGVIRALQPFEFNLGTRELRVADPTKDLVAVSLTGLPLAWVRPFTGEMEVAGGDISGEFAASARDGGLALRASSPLGIKGLTLKNGGKLWLEDIDLRLNVSADYTPHGWQAEVIELLVLGRNHPLLSLNAKAGQLSGENQAVKATGKWSADLLGWTSQPMAEGEFQLSAGKAQGEFSASLNGTNALEAKIALSDLRAVSKEPLPVIHLELRTDIAPSGQINFNAPILIEQSGRKSDLLFAGTTTPGKDGSIVEARLSSERIVVEDLQLLSLVLGKESPPKPAPEKEPETGPFWNGLGGNLTLALKKVVYGGTFEMSDVGGTFRLEPSALKLENLRAALGAESDLKLAGGLKFDGKAAEPYALAADLAVTNLDTKRAFQKVDPASLPTVEALVNLNGQLSSTGNTLHDVAERSHGNVQVTARSGLFRALSTDMTDKVQKNQTTAAAIGGLIGAVTGKKEYADYANKTQILNDIAKALSEIPFDQLNVTAFRDTALNVVLKDFTLISPEVRLTGTGGINYAEGLSLLAQPLTLQLSLGARGQLADLLKRAGLLESKQDNLGYAAFAVPIKIGGSIAKTDTSELRNALLNSALEKSGLLDSLLRK